MSILKRFTFLISILLSPFSCSSWGQSPKTLPDHVRCEDPLFHEKVLQTVNLSIPVMDVEELNNIQDEVYIFDAREKEEYEVSHIPGARYLGYQSVDWNALGMVPSDAKIVVYCSIGYRSEKIGEQLKNKGFTNVHNLYGSIFEWANRGYGLEGKDGHPTNRIHTYNKNWSKWMLNDALVKIW